MVLARMGDDKQASFVINRIMEEPLRDVILFRLELLSYIKHSEAIKILVDILFKNDLINTGTGVKLSSPNFVIGQLSTSLKGFPVKKLSFGWYSEDNISEARRWVENNREKFEIRRDTW
jgi:hypothetical protein